MILGYFLLFLMLAFPMAMSLLYVKIAIFAFLVLAVAVRAITSFKFDIDPKLLIGAVAFSSMGLLFCLEGMLRGTPGAMQCLRVYVLWPLIYTFLLGGIDKEKALVGIERTMIGSTVFIGVFGILFFLSSLSIIPHIPFEESLLSSSDLGVGYHEGHVELMFPGLNSLVFLVPFVFALAVTRQTNRFWPYIAVLVTLPIIILSGRRALQVVTILAPLLTYLFGRYRPAPEKLIMTHRLKIALVFAAVLIPGAVGSLGGFTDLTAEGLKDRLYAGFDFSDSTNESSFLRAEQYRALTASIVDRPLLGYGLGATNHNSVRSAETPWSYELYYVAIIYQVGFAGFAAYASGILWVYILSIRIIKSDHRPTLAALMVGLTSLLIATATNPYLDRFDGIWAIFLPLSFINYEVLRGSGPHLVGKASASQTKRN